MQHEEGISTVRQDDVLKAPFWINRNFALLATGQVISNIGDFVYSMTLMVWVFSLTKSAGAVSGVLLAQYVPMFMLGPLAGVFVDRWNRRTVMLVADAVRTLIALLPLLAPNELRLPAIYVSVFLITSFGRFFMPAKSGVLQAIVSGKELMQASSISQTLSAGALIIGPALSAPLYFSVGPLAALVVNAASYLVSALCIFFIRAPRAALHPYAEREGEASGISVRSVLGELGAGLKFVVSSRVLLALIVMILVAMLGAGALNALDVVFVSKNLHAAPALYGLLNSVVGVGMLVGTLLAALLARRISATQLLTGSMFLLGVGIFIYALQTWYVIALVLAFFMFMPQGGLQVGFGPLFMRSTPPEMMGRAQAMLDVSSSGASLISIGAAGYLGQYLPISWIFSGSALLIVLAGLYGWFALRERRTVPQVAS
ncbi:MFS transporter [Dictyobacter sp. S3.2.2.5]|uniref:MFS transporter n=1 Tax=Dictyobacter halimunensis TaxID=3026934 RepID=A0ABQ6G1M4_9CHLR|nr:MFS transporter [Dictyobacter sp. S3.2.2.5]